MSTAWISLWTRTLAIAAGSPEVMARRVDLLQSTDALTPAGLREAQSMWMEKLAALTEAWCAVGRVTLSTVRWPETLLPLWWLPAEQERYAQITLQAANQILLPVSDRVSANVQRLREH